MFSRISGKKFTALTSAAAMLLSLASCGGGKPEPEGQPPAQTVEEIKAACGMVSTNAGNGSGFIIDESGLVVTAYHVVAGGGKALGATEAEFVLNPGEGGAETFPVEGVVAYNETLDLAVLRIKAGRPLPCAVLGDSDALSEGQGMVVVSAPEGDGGFANATAPTVFSNFDDGGGMRLIRFEAGGPVAGGSSGGAVVAMEGGSGKGRVVGALAFNNGGAPSIYGATPINYIKGWDFHEEGVGIGELNAKRGFYLDEYGGGMRAMGGRYDESGGAKESATFGNYSDGSAWLYDKFTCEPGGGQIVGDMCVQQGADGGFFLAQFAKGPYYSLGYDSHSDGPIYYFGKMGGKTLDGYAAMIYEGGEKCLTCMDGGIRSGPTIRVGGDGWVNFVNYEGGKLDGGSAMYNVNDARLYFSRYDGGVEAAVAYSADIRGGGFYVRGLDGGWVQTAPPGRFICSADDGSGKITDAATGLAFSWSNGAAAFRMETAALAVDGKGGGIYAEIKGVEEFDPCISAKFMDGNAAFKAGGQNEYTYFLYGHDGGETSAAIVDDAKKRVAAYSGEYWYVGGMAENNFSLIDYLDKGDYSFEGNGARYDVGAEELYIGAFLDGQPNGWGTVINRSYVPLTGEWEGGRLVAADAANALGEK